MSSKLFHFRVAKPIEPEDATAVMYDPQSQTSIWAGEGRALAYSCTRSTINGWWQYCSANPYTGQYCSLSGSKYTGYYVCDG